MVLDKIFNVKPLCSIISILLSLGYALLIRAFILAKSICVLYGLVIKSSPPRVIAINSSILVFLLVINIMGTFEKLHISVHILKPSSLGKFISNDDGLSSLTI